MMVLMCGAPKGDNPCATDGLPRPPTEPGRSAPWVGWDTTTNLLALFGSAVFNELCKVFFFILHTSVFVSLFTTR